MLPTIVLLGLVSLAFTGTARAQHCGSYVTLPGDEALALTLGLHIELDHIERDGVPAGLPPSEEPIPVPQCEGPGCSRAPAAPSSAPVSLEPPGVEHWAVTACSDDADGPDHSRRPASDDPLRLPCPIEGIFHPPRAA